MLDQRTSVWQPLEPANCGNTFAPTRNRLSHFAGPMPTLGDASVLTKSPGQLTKPGGRAFYVSTIAFMRMAAATSTNETALATMIALACNISP